jgi:hypothetical protein
VLCHQRQINSRALAFMNSLLTTPTSGALVLADRLADWSSMAAGAFAGNTIRAWKADWESREATVGDLRDVVNPSLETAGKTSCFSRRGDHPPSLRSKRNKHNGHEAAVTAVISNSTIAGAGPL